MTGFYAQALVKSIDDHSLSVQVRQIDDDVQTPKTFKYNDWIDWQQSVITYLKAKKGITDVPLYYMILPDPCNISPADMSKDDNIIYNAPHNTRASTTNNQNVHHTLDEPTTGKDVADWINTHP